MKHLLEQKFSPVASSGHPCNIRVFQELPSLKALENLDDLRENGELDASGRICIDKVMMTYETVYEEVCYFFFIV